MACPFRGDVKISVCMPLHEHGIISLRIALATWNGITLTCVQLKARCIRQVALGSESESRYIHHETNIVMRQTSMFWDRSSISVDRSFKSQICIWWHEDLSLKVPHQGLYLVTRGPSFKCSSSSSVFWWHTDFSFLISSIFSLVSIQNQFTKIEPTMATLVRSHVLFNSAETIYINYISAEW